MHAIQFEKKFAEGAIDAIKTGKPIPAPAEGWTGHAMLSLGGILFATVFSHGSQRQRALGISLDEFRKTHPEKREAVHETLRTDIHDAIEFVSHMAFQVIDGEYDSHFEPVVKAVVFTQEDGKTTVTPVEGFKSVG